MTARERLPHFGIASQAFGNGVVSAQLLCLCMIIAGCQEPAQTETAPGGPLGRKAAALTKEEAIAIARKAIEGKADLQKGAPVTVERTEDIYVVTFVQVNPPGSVGADYAARVTIDARTGKVTELLGGL